MNELMQGEKGITCEEMDYLCIDICDIEESIENNLIELNSFDVIIDKALLDCILCSDDESLVFKAIENIHRCLISGGTYFLVSR
jgi:hypothetical protein